MKKLMRRTMAVVATLAFGFLAQPSTASAGLSAGAQRCVTTFTTSAAKVADAQGNIVRDCLKRFAAGTLISSTPEACMITDRDVKLRKAAFLTESAYYFMCSAERPDFGVTDLQPAVVMAASQNIEVLRRVLGPNLNTALIPTATGSRCQVKVAGALQKCADARVSAYMKCMRKGMAAGTVKDAESLQNLCLGTGDHTQPDPTGKIASACEESIAKSIGRYCEDVDLKQAFSPCDSSTVSGVTSCVVRESACKVCQVLNSVNGLSQDCDAFDDGDPNDGTCGDECSDGIIQPGERCDDGNTDGSDGCAADCTVEKGWVCSGEPSVCSPSCGNGSLEKDEAEQCDDGNTVDGDGCSSTCTNEDCANGRLDSGETCDDGNHDEGDGCNAQCVSEPGYQCVGTPSVCSFVCGNGSFQPGEDCDDGNTTDGDGCSPVCKIESGYACVSQPSACTAVCGDGLLRNGEGCDDGNRASGDGCSSTCHDETGYSCSGEPSVCSSVCGDGYIRKDETCDDRNTTGGDGCSSTCRQEASWTCVGQPSVCAVNCPNGRVDAGEACDDGNQTSGDGCSACTVDAGYACAGNPSLCSRTCGNRRIEPEFGEDCDDGNSNGGDGCSSSCTIEPGYYCDSIPSHCTLTCSNGIIQSGLGEACDDGNTIAGDGCSKDCEIEPAFSCLGQPSFCFLTCGNGQVDVGESEQCDDANVMTGDGCAPDCTTEPGWYCHGNPSTCQEFDVSIDAPDHGTFSADGTIVVSGHYTVLPGERTSLLINGETPNVSFNPETRVFAHRIALNQTNVFNPVDVTLADSFTGADVHDRIVVVAGNSVSRGDYSPESVALRVNESGLSAMEGLIKTMASSGLDITSLMPANAVLVDTCFIDVGFLGCWGRAKVMLSNPAPSIGGIGFKADARPGAVHGDISIGALRIQIAIQGSGLVPSCGLRVSADSLNLGGDFNLEPALADPSHVSVDNVGSMLVSFLGFAHKFTSGICSWPIIGDIINAVLPDLQKMAGDGIKGFLDDPDGSGPGKGAIADAIEGALDGVDISGPVGQGVGLSFSAPLFEVAEDNAGVTVGANARFMTSIGSNLGQCVPPAGTPQFAASYSRYEAFPSFGATSPVKGLPYGLGIAISSGGFNQLLRGQTECGLMRTSLSEIDLDGPAGSPALPITSDILSVFVPSFAQLPPGTPLRIDLYPTLAPIVSGQPGPHGEVADLRIAQLAVNIVDPSTQAILLSGAFDARLGLDLAFLPDGSGLGININKPGVDDVKIKVLYNPLHADEAAVESVLPNIMAPLIPSLASALSGFPLPQFFGMQLQGVEVSRNSEFLSLYANLVPVN